VMGWGYDGMRYEFTKGKRVLAFVSTDILSPMYQ
jgi:hypothetical protein